MRAYKIAVAGAGYVGMAMAVLCVLFSTTALLILNTVIDHRKVH